MEVRRGAQYILQEHSIELDAKHAFIESRLEGMEAPDWFGPWTSEWAPYSLEQFKAEYNLDTYFMHGIIFSVNQKKTDEFNDGNGGAISFGG